MVTLTQKGNLSDTIPPDKQDDIFHYISNIELPYVRNSQDKSENPRGNELLEICKSFDPFSAVFSMERE